MTTRTVQDVLPVLHDMAGLETALAALYAACGERFAEDRDFWEGIRRQEERHAQVVERLAALVTTHPDQFQVGRTFNSVAIRTIRANIESYTAKVREGQLARERAFFVARDIENSVLETNYAEAVRTDNLQFRQAMARLDQETQAHKQAFSSAGAKH